MRVGYSLGMNAMQRIRLTVFAILLATASALPAHSQSATGSIEGIVLDSSGAVLPGVTVTAVHRDTGASRSTVSDESGLFRLPLLPVGTYEVTAELGGFSTRKQPEVVPDNRADGHAARRDGGGWSRGNGHRVRCLTRPRNEPHVCQLHGR